MSEWREFPNRWSSLNWGSVHRFRWLVVSLRLLLVRVQSASLLDMTWASFVLQDSIHDIAFERILPSVLILSSHRISLVEWLVLWSKLLLLSVKRGLFLDIISIVLEMRRSRLNFSWWQSKRISIFLIEMGALMNGLVTSWIIFDHWILSTFLRLSRTLEGVIEIVELFIKLLKLLNWFQQGLPLSLSTRLVHQLLIVEGRCEIVVKLPWLVVHLFILGCSSNTWNAAIASSRVRWSPSWLAQVVSFASWYSWYKRRFFLRRLHRNLLDWTWREWI